MWDASVLNPQLWGGGGGIGRCPFQWPNRELKEYSAIKPKVGEQEQERGKREGDRKRKVIQNRNRRGRKEKRERETV